MGYFSIHFTDYFLKRKLSMNYCYNMSRKGFIISNILFGFVHCMNEPSIGIFIRSILLYSLLGGIMSYIYYRTKRIEYSVLIHMLANFFGCNRFLIMYSNCFLFVILCKVLLKRPLINMTGVMLAAKRNVLQNRKYPP